MVVFVCLDFISSRDEVKMDLILVNMKNGIFSLISTTIPTVNPVLPSTP